MLYALLFVCYILCIHVSALSRHHHNDNQVNATAAQQLNQQINEQHRNYDEVTERSYYESLDLPSYWQPTILADGTIFIDTSSLHSHTRHHNQSHDHNATTKSSSPVTPTTSSPTPAPTTVTPKPTQPKPIEIRNNRIYTHGKPMNVQGICYSPVPVGESVNWPPMGDYFTPDYAYIWQRDLPMIRAMGMQ